LWADANTAIVGGPGNRDFEPNGAVGGAWVFTQSGGTWSQQATLVGSDAFGTSGQGFSVALSANGNTAIIGGPYDNGYTGAAWVFVQPPSVAEVVPAGGPPSGGTAVTITGTGFIDATAVNFGSASAASFAINSGTSITATSPAGTGAVDVTVTSPVGVSTTSPAGQYTYFYTIAVSAAPAADGTVEGGGDYTAGSVQTVTAVPNSGYAFVNWTQNGAVGEYVAELYVHAQFQRVLGRQFQHWGLHDQRNRFARNRRHRERRRYVPGRLLPDGDGDAERRLRLHQLDPERQRGEHLGELHLHAHIQRHAGGQLRSDLHDQCERFARCRRHGERRRDVSDRLIANSDCNSQ